MNAIEQVPQLVNNSDLGRISTGGLRIANEKLRIILAKTLQAIMAHYRCKTAKIKCKFFTGLTLRSS
jgi:hypothetical protein